MSYEVIAIGASWGGLQAVGTLLEGIPQQLDQTIVVAQHRSAESSRGVLESLLQRHIGRPVSEPAERCWATTIAWSSCCGIPSSNVPTACSPPQDAPMAITS